MKYKQFNEDTRVKIPATFQFLRIGYNYQSLSDADIDFNTKIFVNRFKPAIEKINNKRYSDSEVLSVLSEIHTLIRNNDYGRSFYMRLINTTADIKLIDFDNIENNDFAVVDELSFTIEKDTEEGSFRPDVNILINGMPLAFLEVKKPNNDGGIQAEFDRMINRRLVNPAYHKYFNLIQIVSFSNNMEYENEDSDDMGMVKAGSFYTAPNGLKTSFSFFREDEKGYLASYPYKTLDDDTCREYIKDLGYDPINYDSVEFKTNDQVTTPCNRFITSLFDKERLLFMIRYGMMYIKANNDNPPEKRKKAAFVSKKWFYDLANYRRDGYDFDARVSDGLANYNEEFLYNIIASRHSILSKTAKAIGGYVKPREKGKDSWEPRKGFDTTITNLQMKGYVLITDFDYEVDKNGEFYGWGIARYATPEEYYGKTFADKCYKRTPEESYERLFRQIKKLTGADEFLIRRFLG